MDCRIGVTLLLCAACPLTHPHAHPTLSRPPLSPLPHCYPSHSSHPRYSNPPQVASLRQRVASAEATAQECREGERRAEESLLKFKSETEAELARVPGLEEELARERGEGVGWGAVRDGMGAFGL